MAQSCVLEVFRLVKLFAGTFVYTKVLKRVLPALLVSLGHNKNN